jgi:capsular exopolysaccharide synthesis family protein
MRQAVQVARDAQGFDPARSGASREGYTFAPSLVMISRPLEGTAEAIRALRTHIMAQHVQEGRRALAICTPSKGAGCTFTAANLAVALSQIGVKTLLVDGDLRQPSVHQIIRPPRLADGLRHCLSTRDVGYDDSIETDVLPNLSILYSGGAAPNPQELLSNDRFQGLMQHWMRDYDLTIVDTPAANTSSDARRISTVCGYSLVVTRRHLTMVDDVRTLIAQIRADHGRVIGTILNEA